MTKEKGIKINDEEINIRKGGKKEGCATEEISRKQQERDRPQASENDRNENHIEMMEDEADK